MGFLLTVDESEEEREAEEFPDDAEKNEDPTVEILAVLVVD